MVQDPGFRIHDLRLQLKMVQVLRSTKRRLDFDFLTNACNKMIKVQNLGFRIQDLGYRIQDTRFGIQDTGFRIQDRG